MKSERDQRQEEVLQWAAETFGSVALDQKERMA